MINYSIKQNSLLGAGVHTMQFSYQTEFALIGKQESLFVVLHCFASKLRKHDAKL